MANERPTSSRLIVKRLRLPYEAPRLQITALRPEEQLLTCSKIEAGECVLFPDVS